jgi:hypothetical protein
MDVRRLRAGLLVVACLLLSGCGGAAVSSGTLKVDSTAPFKNLGGSKPPPPKLPR